MNKIDMTIQQVCTTCQIERPLRYQDGLITVNEHTTVEVRVDPDEFPLCPTCGNPTRLRIKTQPYEFVSHLDTPVARALYDMGHR